MMRHSLLISVDVDSMRLSLDCCTSYNNIACSGNGSTRDGELESIIDNKSIIDIILAI